MANPEQLDILKQDVEAWNKWRDRHLDITPDLTGADFGGVSLVNADLHRADLRGADLNEADLRGANLHEANLCGANLAKAALAKADLRKANLSRAHFLSATLSGADLSEADLSGANFHAADLSGASLSAADLRGAKLYEANLRGTELAYVKGAPLAYGLETTRFTLAPSKSARTYTQTGLPAPVSFPIDPTSDTIYFETCERSWLERWLDWERLRIVGRLPLFGISYTVLIMLPIIFYGLALYNDKIGLIRTWAEQLFGLPDHLSLRLGPLILDRLHPRPIPSQSFLLLLSTIFLAVGSTLYTLFCPSRIKEFSRDQWCDQFGRPLLHYWPLAWKHRYLRIVSAACYAFGGVGGLWVLGTKVWHTALFILKHSTFP